MNKRTRYWVRRILLLLMAGMVAFALYQTLNDEKDTGPQQGQPAPNFQLETLDGDSLELSDLQGKTVLINFWATWCKPCRTEMPDIQKIYEQYRDEGFEVVAVNIAENPVSVKGFARQLELDFPIVLDRDRKVTKQYNIGPLPASLFIAKDGKVVRKQTGQMSEKQIEGYVREALSK